MENEKEKLLDTPIPVIQPQKSKRYLIFVLLGGFIILGTLAYIFLLKNNSQAAEKLRANLPIPTQIIPTPTPYLFREITIPYLRERSYKSSITEKTLSYENASFTAYIASYDSEGFKVNGLLTQPKGEMPAGGWPAIVFIHGYIPPSQYQTNGAAYTDYVNYLASSGFVVYKIDLRGHGNSEGQPGGAYFSADYTIDVLNAYAALQNTDFVNPQKIGLWGHSMAGISNSLHNFYNYLLL